MIYSVDNRGLGARMRALDGNLIPQKKREGRVVKIMLNNSLPAVDKGAPIYRIRVPLFEANAL